jgi:hypothetical protein
MSHAKRELEKQMEMDEIEEMIDLDVLDPEDDADIIAAMTAQVEGETLTPEQTALLDKNMGRLVDALEEARSQEVLDNALDKDD